MRFVILGDLHYSTYSDVVHAAARDRLFTHFFAEVAAHEPDLVFALGDTTNYGYRSEFQGLDTLIKQSQLPMIRLTGNHDCYTLTKAELAAYFLGSHPSVSDQELYTHLDADTVRFILLDTAREQDEQNYGGFVSEAQLSWLYQQIINFNQHPTLQHFFVLGHHPLYGTTHRSTETMLNVANSDALASVLEAMERLPGFYCCGHNHVHSLAQHPDQRWIYVQTGNPLDCRSFRLVTVGDHDVQIETHLFTLDTPELLADFEMVRQNIPADFSPQPFTDAYGTPADHNLTIRRHCS